MKKSDCSGCHHRQSAGDQCTQCHNYHVHEFQKSGSLTIPPPNIGARELPLRLR
jgi:hypothetical protein